MIGETISHYRIEEKLGEGGMGVVYKARDLRLQRSVALKLLPDRSDDPEARERFLREAQAAAALDHPNICTVHDIDEVDGQTLLAMQFVAGPSVKEKIRQRPLELHEALDIAIQTAEGLKAAHEAGVVHRDIKSSNLMLTLRGEVRIMDFGLARVADRTQITKTASILGTPAYMSPEQAEGKTADHRSDIWSLGVVLYEMITGKLPFTGDNDQSVLFAILNSDPEPVTALRAGLPMELERLLEKALAKDAGDRYQNIADLLVDLRSIRTKGASRIVRAPVAREGETGVRARQRWLPWALVAALAIAAAVAWLPQAEQEAAQPVYRFTIDPPEGAVIRGFEVSPDGRHLAFVASEGELVRLWIHSFDESSARPLDGTQGADLLAAPFWSPDSRYVGFFADGKLKKVGIAGEPPMALANAAFGRGGTWHRSGVIVFTPMNDGPLSRLFQVPATGGTPVPVTSNESNSHRSPQFLPDGRFLFYRRLEAAGGKAELRLGELGSTDTGRLTAAASHGVLLPTVGKSDGYLLTVQEDVLMAYSFHAASEPELGEPFPVVRGVGVDVEMGRGLFSVSASGVLAYSAHAVAVPVRKLVWVNRRGEEMRKVGPDTNYSAVRISPDGARAAVRVGVPAVGYRLEVVDLDDGSIVLPNPGRNNLGMAWAPDSRDLIGFGRYGGSENTAQRALLRIPADGSSEPNPIMYRDGRSTVCDWSPDGSWLLFEDRSDENDSDLFVTSLRGDPEPEPYLDSEYRERSGRFSPDGKYIAYSSDESGADEIYVRPFPNAEAKWKVSFEGGSDPVWGRDGSELFFVSPEDYLMVAKVSFDSAGGFRSGRPERLFRLDKDMSAQLQPGRFDVSPDSQQFLVFRTYETPENPIHVVVNWTQELERIAGERGADR